jgi:hypothetical protein
MSTYIEAISKGFPAVQCHAIGDGSVYSDIVWDGGSALPSQAVLDEWIAANPCITVSNKVTVLAFRNRFTQTEKVTLEMASIDNPAAPAQSRQLQAALRVMMADLNVATFVDLDRAEIKGGVHLLETYGIIGAGRANIILNPATITDIERPPS